MVTGQFQAAETVLRAAGFARVHRVQPVSTDDPEVVSTERALTRPQMDVGAGSPRSVISQSLTHVRLWRTFPTRGEWLWIFEDDVLLHPAVSRPADVPCLMDLIESAAEAVPAPLLYLGPCSPLWPHRSLNAPPARRLFGEHTLSTCAALCLHAYGVRSSVASTLWDIVRATNRAAIEVGSTFFRYNADVNLKGHFYQKGVRRTRNATAANWPLCVNVERRFRLRHNGSLGIFTQNKSLAGQARHTILW